MDIETVKASAKACGMYGDDPCAESEAGTPKEPCGGQIPIGDVFRPMTTDEAELLLTMPVAVRPDFTDECGSTGMAESIERCKTKDGLLVGRMVRYERATTLMVEDEHSHLAQIVNKHANNDGVLLIGYVQVDLGEGQSVTLSAYLLFPFDPIEKLAADTMYARLPARAGCPTEVMMGWIGRCATRIWRDLFTIKSEEITSARSKIDDAFTIETDQQDPHAPPPPPTPEPEPEPASTEQGTQPPPLAHNQHNNNGGDGDDQRL